MGERIDVLRLGHRKGRDPRITTHLALVARAMGADRFLLGGDEDEKMFENVRSVEARFGQAMALEYLASPLGWLRTFAKKDAGDGQPGTVVHLTMYGIPHRQAIPRIRRDRPLRSSWRSESASQKPSASRTTTCRWANNLTPKWRPLRSSLTRGPRVRTEPTFEHPNS